MRYTTAILLVSFFIFTACSKKPEPQPGPNSGNDGYALLYSVASQEQNVDKLLWVKDPGKTIEAWVKDIAAFNKTVTSQLDTWKQSGVVTNLTNVGLPAAEQTARSRAASRTTGELLFSKDIDLRVALVVAQIKAMGYCSDLCYAIGEETDNDEVKKTMADWQKQFAALNSQGMNILEVGMTSGENSAKEVSGSEEKVRPPSFHK